MGLFPEVISSPPWIRRTGDYLVYKMLRHIFQRLPLNWTSVRCLDPNRRLTPIQRCVQDPATLCRKFPPGMRKRKAGQILKEQPESLAGQFRYGVLRV